MFFPGEKRESLCPYRSTITVLYILIFIFLDGRQKVDFRFSQWDVHLLECCTLIMEAVSTSETLLNFYKTTWCNIPEDKSSSGDRKKKN
jgi:hypothetical protein